MTRLLPYKVATFRAAGLLARWTKTRSGAPMIVAADGPDKPWYVVNGAMWLEMRRRPVADLATIFRDATLLGEFFSLPVSAMPMPALPQHKEDELNTYSVAHCPAGHELWFESGLSIDDVRASIGGAAGFPWCDGCGRELNAEELQP